MRRPSAAALAFGLIIITQGTAAAAPSTAELVERLENAADSRIRVLAALQLGRTRANNALEPLLRALDDERASVRAAAAAALELLGDTSAIRALEEHRFDHSASVRNQVMDTLQSLTGRMASSSPSESQPRVRVKLGTIRNGTPVKSPGLERAIIQESRRSLEDLPGVDVLASDDHTATAVTEHDVPVVLVTTAIQKLTVVRADDELVYSANLEYLVHSVPGEAIVARIRGSASATTSPAEVRDPEKRAELRREVVRAAVRSALKNATHALLAATR